MHRTQKKISADFVHCRVRPGVQEIDSRTVGDGKLKNYRDFFKGIKGFQAVDKLIQTQEHR